VDITISPAQLDLSSYAGIISGSRRPDSGSKGMDILGKGKWEHSLLLEFLSQNKKDIPGHTQLVSNLVIFAGKPFPKIDLTETPLPSEAATPIP
jgi:hypothetical protein